MSCHTRATSLLLIGLTVSFTLGCDGGSGADGATPTTAPAIGKADAHDAADSACRVVLRSVHSVAPEARWLTWEAYVDVAEDVGNVDVGVIYQGNFYPGWLQSRGAPVAGAGPGFQRFLVTMEQNTLEYDSGTSALHQFRLEFIPFMRWEDGVRLFDHNVAPAPADNYWLTEDNHWKLEQDPAVCPAAQ